ncbi:MAG TPA: isoprenyl transferase [Gemmatimonadales bacterium]|nr:isoprenyl transferase [Gemmatimonadales bacterium]
MSEELLRQVKVNGSVPAHVAIIMDGNGRWARERALPRPFGHKAGMKAVREVVEGALAAGVEVLTLFAFSQENWQRPADEIGALMDLLQEYIAREMSELKAQGVSVRFLGDLERLSPGARAAVDRLMSHTAEGARLALNICISYGSRAELARAARLLAEDAVAGRLDPAEITEEAVTRRLYTAAWPDPDLLIRTSGEFRLSNFLLWQLAYAELYVTPVLWPDFSRKQLFEALLAYQRRDRRFGKVSA